MTQPTIQTLPSSLYSRFGAFHVSGLKSADGDRAVTLVAGAPGTHPAPLVRIHSQCLTGDVFGSVRCDCGRQLNEALNRLARSGWGILIYQMQEGRGIGLMNKLRAKKLQDRGMDTVEANMHMGFAADERNYSFSAAVLHNPGVKRIRLLSNNPARIQGLEAENIEVIERVAPRVPTADSAERYMRTKREKLGRLL